MSAPASSLIERLSALASYHKENADAWRNTSATCRESMAWIEADPERIARYEESNKTFWAEAKAYNLKCLEWDDIQAAAAQDRADTCLAAVELLRAGTNGN